MYNADEAADGDYLRSLLFLWPFTLYLLSHVLKPTDLNRINAIMSAILKQKFVCCR